MAATVLRLDYRRATKMVVPGPAAADAWAVLAAGRLAAILGKRRAEALDCPWAWDRDFLWVMAGREQSDVPERPDVREWHRAPPLRDEQRTAANSLVQPVVLLALWAE